MSGWAEISRWDLPGPTRFLNKVCAAARGDSGALCLWLPGRDLPGFFKALERRLEVDCGVRALTADAGATDGLAGRSPAHWLAARAAVAGTGIRSVADFIDESDLGDTVFVVHGISAADWPMWTAFLRQMRAERASKPRVAAPVVAVVPPSETRDRDLGAVFGRSIFRWLGTFTRLDAWLLAEKSLGWVDQDDLVAQAEASCVVEIAGWDPEMVVFLADLNRLDRLYPVPRLLDAVRNRPGPPPTWQNGLVDYWDGVPFEHSTSVARRGDLRTLDRRIWRSQVSVLFPFLERVRNAVVRTYGTRLMRLGPLHKTFHDRTVVITDPFDFELYNVHERLKDVIPADESAFIWACHKLRGSMAHMKRVGPEVLTNLARVWDGMAERFQPEPLGWNWPRCGQKLVLLVGPSGAGKSDWARNHCARAELVSSDEVRQELFGSLVLDGDQTPVFERVRALVAERLSNGGSVVVDATHIRARDRLANVAVVPPDLEVEYLVFDRPMEEKIATAGWRLQRPQLLEQHARVFEEELTNILAGDGRSNVKVRDLRSGPLSSEDGARSGELEK